VTARPATCEIVREAPPENAGLESTRSDEPNRRALQVDLVDLKDAVTGLDTW